jgi:hypothetical protein
MAEALLALIAALSLLYLIVLSWDRFEMGAVLLLLGLYVLIPFTDTYYWSLPIGPVALYPEDGLDIVFLAAWVLRQYRRKAPALSLPQGALVMVFLGLISFSLASGFWSFGFSGFVDARRFISSVAPMLYFSSFRYSRQDLLRVFKLLVWTSLVMALIGVARWIFGGVEFSDVPSGYAYLAVRQSIGISVRGLVIVVTWLGLVIARMENLIQAKTPTGLLLIFFPAMLILLQERGLWVVSVASLACVLAMSRQRGVVVRWGLAAGLVLVLVVGVLYALDAPQIKDAVESIQSAAETAIYVPGPGEENYSNLSLRAMGWGELLGHHPLMGYVIGVPFGSGYDRIVAGGLQTFNPHSFYVNSILRLGLGGMLAFLISHLALFRQLKAVQGNATDTFTRVVSGLLLIGMICNLAYCIEYNLQSFGGMMWGMALAIAPALSAVAEREETTVAPVVRRGKVPQAAKSF